METFNNHNEVNLDKNRPEMNVGALLSHAFENYKKTLGWMILFLVLSLLCMLAMSTVAEIISGFDALAMQHTLNKYSGQNPFSTILEYPGYLSYIALSSVSGFLLHPLYVSFPYIMHKANTGKDIQFSDFFIGYQHNAVGFIILSILTSIIASIALALCIVPILFVLPLLYTSSCFILFENATPINAIRDSFKLGNAHYGTVFGFALVSFFIAISGVLLCGIGALVTLPFFYAAVYSVYCAAKGVPN